jgi:hypothetical protein
VVYVTPLPGRSHGVLEVQHPRYQGEDFRFWAALKSFDWVLVCVYLCYGVNNFA